MYMSVSHENDIYIMFIIIHVQNSSVNMYFIKFAEIS